MPFGDRLFGDMSRPEHAYTLGLVAGAGRIEKDVLEIQLRGDDRSLLERLSAKTASDIPTLYEVRGSVVRVYAPLGAIAASFLGAPPGSRDRLRFPDLAGSLGYSFVRGYFDAVGTVSSPKEGKLVVSLPTPPPEFLRGLLEFIAMAPTKVGRKFVRWTGTNALDLLGALYDDFGLEVPPEEIDDDETLPESPETPRPYRPETKSPEVMHLYREKHLARYRKWCQAVLHLSSARGGDSALRVQRLRRDAVLPRKERVSDSGYDLTLLYEAKRHGNVILYGTGLVIEPPQGWYFDVVPRSSIIKRGYLLANNVGIIDRAYRGEIFVPLLKTDPAAKELELPARVAQLIPRPIVHFPVIEAGSVDATHRGAGGFGSTG